MPRHSLILMASDNPVPKLQRVKLVGYKEPQYTFSCIKCVSAMPTCLVRVSDKSVDLVITYENPSFTQEK